MTGLLWAAVGLTAAVATLAFALALALTRRLREVQAQLAASPHVDGFGLPVPGDAVPDFSVPTTTGAAVDSTDLAGDDVVLAFLTTDCESCRQLAGALAADGSGGTRRIAVVIGPDAARGSMVASLEPVADVVEQADHQGLAARFGVQAFPTVLVAGGGTVRAVGHDLDDVRARQSA
jgi:AhpC/TSA family protein